MLPPLVGAVECVSLLLELQAKLEEGGERLVVEEEYPAEAGEIHCLPLDCYFSQQHYLRVATRDDLHSQTSLG